MHGYLRAWRRGRIARLVLVLSALGLVAPSTQAQLLYLEPFDGGLGETFPTDGNDATNAWRFRLNCPSNALSGHTTPGAARWGNPGDCANYGFPLTGDLDRLTTSNIDIDACGPDTAVLTFNYYLDLQEGFPGDLMSVNAIVDGISTSVADNGFTFNNLVNAPGSWQSLSVSIPDGSLFAGEFVGRVQDSIANLAEGFVVDDLQVSCLAIWDGFPDGTFDGDGKTTVDFAFDTLAEDVAIQSDGKIVIAGYTEVNPNRDMAVARLNEDGSLDSSFGSGGRVIVAFDLDDTNDDRGHSVALQQDGKILVAGSAKVPSGFDFAVLRLDDAGNLDTTFDGDGRVTVDMLGVDSATGVAVQADGKIVVAGTENIEAIDGSNFAVLRLDANGTPDPTFNGDGRVSIDFSGLGDEAEALLIQPDGKIVVAGSARSASRDFAVARLLADGTLDPGFGNAGKATIAFDLGGNNDDFGFDVDLDPDGSIVVAGAGTDSSGVHIAVARLTSGGVLDSSFDGDGKAFISLNIGPSNQERSDGVVVQPNGSIVIAASAFANGNFGVEMAVLRLAADGSLDTTFSADGVTVFGLDEGGNNDDFANAVALQSDGSIVVAGYSLVGPTSASMSVARLGRSTIVFVDDFEAMEVRR